MENIQQNQNISQPIADDEIDMIALAKTLWKGKKTVIKFILICGMIGLAVALLSPKEYTATTVVVPQAGKSGSRLGGLSSLAAMAGFNLDNMSSGSEALSPMVYPQILGSVPFQLELMNTPFHFQEVDHPVSIYEYYTHIKKPGFLSQVKKYTVGLPGVIINALRPKAEDLKTDPETQLLSLTKEQEEIRKFIEEKVSLNVNSKEGYLSITANLPEASLAAEVTQYTLKLLQKYITQLKVEKANEQLSFIHERYNEKKKEFESTQETLARFRDRNKNVSTAMAQTEQERLQSEYSIALSVYTELAKQLEQAQIQVKEDTPVFSILKPAVVPNERSKPKKAMILMIWLFLGGVIGTGVVFGKQYIGSVKEKWTNSNELQTNSNEH